MSIDWNFNKNEVEEQSYDLIPVGDHRVRIKDAEETKSKSGNDMIKLTLEVSGYHSTIWYYLVFMPDNSKLTNTKLSQLWESFGINEGNMDVQNWVGKVGAARVKHEIYQGEPQPRISYFKTQKQQEKIPPWKEPENSSSSAPSSSGFEQVSVDTDDDLPF